MKLTVYSRYDWLLQLIVLPLYIGLLNWILIGNAYWQVGATFGLATAIALADSFLIWYSNNVVALKINRLYPDPKYYRLRVLRRYAATGANAAVHIPLLVLIYRLIGLPGFQPDGIRMGLGVLYTLVIVAIVVVTYEGMDNFDYWQQSRRQVDVLSKAQLQAQLDALRQQVNPHFLFNALNSLSALIAEDRTKATLFLDELSSVYRYLLRANRDSHLTELASQLEFIQSYFHLLKTRHGAGLSLEIAVPEWQRTHRLPPLTLQLLVENAVKHNTVLPEQPLRICIETATGQRLVVRNNLQRKPSRALSNGVGLGNILSKYRMLGQPAPVIEDDGTEFRVTLPLA